MLAQALAQGRKARGYSQMQAAKALGVSQSYLSMLETGEREVTAALVREALRVYRLPPTLLPLPAELGAQAETMDPAAELTALGYAGFPGGRKRPARNPAWVLLAALARKNLDARVFEGLPWLLLRYAGLDVGWMVRQAKLNDLQNRLGYVASLARRYAEAHASGTADRAALWRLEAAIEPSRLQREDTLCRESMTAPERDWLRLARPPEAAHWNLLTGVTPEQLRYVE